MEPFLTEGTISRYDAREHGYYTIILRNVNDRVVAERKIETLSAQTQYLRSQIDEAEGFDEIVGDSPSLRAALEAVTQVAQTDATVLVHGETGTGKELFARAIHKRSRRADGPMIKVNCAAIPPTLMESEFFGHEKGAFTGATQRRDGRFALAHGGTIFLDEIGELPLELQGKLLRVLQEGEFEPVGGSSTRTIDVRVVVATNRDLSAAINEGSFREDLYYRLNVFPLRLPPLRERGDDIILIAKDLVAKLSRSMGRTPRELTPAAIESLKRYSWPGNVRELRNVIERALIVGGDTGPRVEQVLAEFASPASGAETGVAGMHQGNVVTEEAFREAMRLNLIAALEQCDWRVGGDGGAAELIGISPSTFKSRMKTFDINRPSK